MSTFFNRQRPLAEKKIDKLYGMLKVLIKIVSTITLKLEYPF